MNLMTPVLEQRPVFWTKKRMKRAAWLWNKGVSAGLIGEELGCTRNSVIGWVYRHRDKYKLESRDNQGRRVKYRIKKGLQKTTHPPRKKDPRHPGKKTDATWVAKPRAIVLPCQRPVCNVRPDTLLDNRSCGDYRAPHAKYPGEENPGCKWPIGLVGTPEFHFCGSVRREAKPYCDSHCQRAYAREIMNV